MPAARLQHLGDQMMRGADADAADRQLAGLGLGARDHLGEGLDAELLAGAERIDAVAGLADRNEIAKQIDIGVGLHRGVGGVRARGLQKRMAVRLRLLDAQRADLPAAPATFSTMMGWPSAFSMPACAIRTAVSAGPPGGNGTMILIGLVGNAWAEASRGSAAAESAAAAESRKERRFIGSILAVAWRCILWALRACRLICGLIGDAALLAQRADGAGQARGR